MLVSIYDDVCYDMEVDEIIDVEPFSLTNAWKRFKEKVCHLVFNPLIELIAWCVVEECHGCDAPKPGGPLTTRQPAENKWMSGYPTPLQKIGQSLLCTGSSTQLQNLHIPVPNNPIYAK